MELFMGVCAFFVLLSAVTAVVEWWTGESP
jgi:hypothetical protein